MKDKIKITYRGWAGHFICGHKCQFRLNTLIELGDTRVVVSTVGRYLSPLKKEFDTIGYNRHYETMAFHAVKDGEFWDADVGREVSFESEWAWPQIDDEWRANKGHIAVVEEIKQKMISGENL